MITITEVEDSDEALMIRVQGNDPRAFELLYDR
ncbi:MAG: hypothetical protein QOD61_179, partial [Solirubrobacteraceae bacterium]|nr:hypothetical protein [Solirubrobacteraceae bacterium]